MQKIILVIICFRINLHIKRVKKWVKIITIQIRLHITIIIIKKIQIKKCFWWIKTINKVVLIIIKIQWWSILNKWINKCFRCLKTFKTKALSKTTNMVEKEILNTSKNNMLPLNNNKGEIWWDQLVKTINKISSSSTSKIILTKKIRIRMVNPVNSLTKAFKLIPIGTTKKINNNNRKNTKKITKRTKISLNLFNFLLIMFLFFFFF